jgi:hypothetical protein
MHELTGKQITQLMRQHGQQIAGLAKSMQITQMRVREVRRKGVKGPGYIRRSPPDPSTGLAFNSAAKS